ncbi:unnamed protein product, partial [Effrenium voratum]
RSNGRHADQQAPHLSVHGSSGHFSYGKHVKLTGAKVICTLREGPAERCEDWGNNGEETSPSSPKYSSITLGYDGEKTTLRPWDPSRCPFGAAIYNRLIHFPIRPKGSVFAIFCSLQSLSHLSDTLGRCGHLIGVLNPDSSRRPKPDIVHRFLLRHPNTTLIFEDINVASLERYERLLSLPVDSRYAFLMALHPRLGAQSPARLLKDDAEKLCNNIFKFLVCTTPSLMKTLVLWHPEQSLQEESDGIGTFDQVLKHIDILQRWRKPRVKIEKKSSEGEHSETNERIWIFMDIRTDKTTGGNLDMKFVNDMAKMGLLAKEQLSLTPWFPSQALLLFQYALHRDERHAPSSGQSEGLQRATERRVKEERMRKERIHQPPSPFNMPVPSFGGFGCGNGLAGRSDMPAAPAPAPSMPMKGGGFNGMLGPDMEDSSEMLGLPMTFPDPVNASRNSQMGQSYPGPPGLSAPQAPGSQQWMSSEESKLLYFMQAQSAAPGQWPVEVQQAQWQAMYQQPGMSSASSAQQLLGKGGLGKGGQPQWHRQLGQGQAMISQQLQFANTREDQMSYLAMNL